MGLSRPIRQPDTTNAGEVPDAPVKRPLVGEAR